MWRDLLLISTVTSVLVLGYFLPKWMGPANCINSSLVERIDIAGMVHPLLECNLKNRTLTQPPPDWVQKAQILDRIESLEFMTRYWPEPEQKIQLKLDTSDDAIISFRDSSLQLGPVSMNKPGVMEKALMSYWLGLKDPVTAETATEFLWQTHLAEQYPQESHKKFRTNWLSRLVSLRTYCGLRLNVLQHEDFCSIQRQLEEGLVVKESEEGSVQWSFHKILSQILTSVFHKLELEDKRNFVRNLIFLNPLEEPYELASIADVESLYELDIRFWKQVRYFFSSLDIEAADLWKATGEYLVTTNTKAYNYTIVESSLHWQLPKTYPPNSQHFVEHGAAKYLFPSDVPSRISRHQLLSKLPIQNLSIVACETPSPGRLLELKAYVKKVLFVRVCPHQEQLLTELLMETPAQRIKADRDLEFIEFNLRSLEMAIEQKGDLPKNDGLQAWSQWLEWKDFVYDSERSAFRPRANFDGIGWFRTAN